MRGSARFNTVGESGDLGSDWRLRPLIFQDEPHSDPWNIQANKEIKLRKSKFRRELSNDRITFACGRWEYGRK